ncbi:hypothetical protein SCALM49S_05385 [Streptomyces californicus]
MPRPARTVELPVGASEDRLVGALDIERALSEGVKAFEPGLLADAHRGILYVDEVNLLHDHLVDLLLDAAAMGASYVEREGVSVRHAARFLLVGTMNPEEGELRPQLLDRFGLTVWRSAASRDTDERVEVVRRRLAYDDDPEGFAARWAEEEGALRERIAAARALLPRVVLGDGVLRQIAATCAAFEVDGMRADIVMARTATALAAWAGREEVTADDVRQAALLALPTGGGATRWSAPVWTRTSSTRPWTRPAGTGGRTTMTLIPAPTAGATVAVGAAECRRRRTARTGRRRGPTAVRTTRRRRPRRVLPTRPAGPPGASSGPWPPPNRSGRRRSACRGSARALRGGVPGPVPEHGRTTGSRPARGGADQAAPGRDRAGRRPAPACARARRARARGAPGRSAAGDPGGARGQSGACASWTPPGRWRPGSG